MRLKTKIKLAVIAVPVVAVVVAGGALAIGVHTRRLRRKKASSFLSGEVRSSLQDLCSLKGEDFVPDGRGSSLYQRRLETLTDKQLIGVYVAIKVAEVLRSRGVDIHQMSKDDVVSEVLTLRAATHDNQDRHELIRRLGSFGAETIRSMLGDALLIAGMAVQAA